MTDIWLTGLYGLGVMLLTGIFAWPYRVYRTDVSVADSLWPLMFLAGAVVYSLLGDDFTTPNMALLALVAMWPIRLSIFLTVRNWGQDDDRRYREIRANNEPCFNFKNLYIIPGKRRGNPVYIGGGEQL